MAAPAPSRKRTFSQRSADDYSELIRQEEAAIPRRRQKKRAGKQTEEFDEVAKKPRVKKQRLEEPEGVFDGIFSDGFGLGDPVFDAVYGGRNSHLTKGRMDYMTTDDISRLGVPRPELSTRLSECWRRVHWGKKVPVTNGPGGSVEFLSSREKDLTEQDRDFCTTYIEYFSELVTDCFTFTQALKELMWMNPPIHVIYECLRQIGRVKLWKIRGEDDSELECTVSVEIVGQSDSTDGARWSYETNNLREYRTPAAQFTEKAPNGEAYLLLKTCLGRMQVPENREALFSADPMATVGAFFWVLKTLSGEAIHLVVSNNLNGKTGTDKVDYNQDGNGEIILCTLAMNENRVSREQFGPASAQVATDAELSRGSHHSLFAVDLSDKPNLSAIQFVSLPDGSWVTDRNRLRSGISIERGGELEGLATRVTRETSQDILDKDEKARAAYRKSETFRRRSEAARWAQTDEGKAERAASLQCTVEGCGKAFAQNGDLKKHVQGVHEGARPFKCTVEGCGKAFAQNGDLKKHVQGVHEGARPFKCTVEGCGKAFAQNGDLKKHVQGVHEGARPFKCTVEGCGKAFQMSGGLKTHVQSVHEGARPFKCTVDGCGKAFSESGGLKTHVQSVHEGARPFKCTVDGCGKAFSENGALKTHVRSVHEGARPFKCTVEGCGKAFSENGTLKTHVRSVHEGARPFQCAIEGCGKAFSENGNLETHVRSVHEGVRPFPCTVEGCGKSFARRSNLDRHVRNVHKGENI